MRQLGTQEAKRRIVYLTKGERKIYNESINVKKKGRKMVKIRQYLRPNAMRMAFGLTLKVVGTIAELLLPLLLGYMLDDSESSPVRDTKTLLFFGGCMLVLAVVALYANIIGNRLASRVARDATYKLRGDLFAKTLSLSARQIDGCTIPTLISRLSTDTYNVHNMLGMMQRLGVRVPVFLIGGLAFAFILEPVLTLILVAILPFMLVVVVLIAKRGIALYARLQGSVDSMVRKIRDDYAGIRVIKALSKTDYESNAFREEAGNVAKDEMRAGLWTGVSNPLVSLFLNLGMVAIVLVGAFRVDAGRMSAGKIVAFVSYFTLILNAALLVSRLFVTLSKGTASGRRICEILNLPVEPLAIEAAGQGDASVEFRNVSFSYGTVKALQNISFRIKRGERMGVLGATGSGKSTLVQLMLRFYDATDGEIYLDGENVTSIETERLRKKFGMVFQNDFIMAGTVYDNVDFCRNVGEEAVVRALRAAQADFVFEREEGLDFMLAAHGANLSGGQKQRILIARALAGMPRVLILDDSSSALDYRTDAALRAALAREYPDLTCIFIAQRIGAVQNCDFILVLENGRAAGIGTHAQLLQTCETYREIARSQGGDVHE